MRVRGPSKERQEAIARELGLLPPAQPQESAFQMEQRRLAEEGERRIALMRERVRNYPLEPEHMCLDCPGGRHKIEGKGWCVDGVFYAFSDTQAIRRLQTVHGEKFMKVFPALQKFHSVIALDFASAEVNPLDDVR